MSSNFSEKIKHPKDGSRKHRKERQTENLSLSKPDSPKKKKKDKAKHEVEPTTNAGSKSGARNREERLDSPRKRNAEMNEYEQRKEDLALSTSKKKKEVKSLNMDMIVKQEPAIPGENSSRHSRKRQQDDPDLGELASLKHKKINSEKEFDLARVKTEPNESPKKKKHSKTKTC